MLRTATLLIVPVILSCGTVVRVDSPMPDSLPEPPEFLSAGVGEVDITPPPGIPPAGFSLAAKHKVFKGFRTRLHARFLVLRDSDGDVFAWVVADLGQSSSLLHRLISARVAEETGITPDRLLFSATHTHSGPSGFAAWDWYNALGSPILLSGYDPGLVGFLVDRISGAILDVWRKGLVPCSLRIRRTIVSGLTRNRSMAAFRENGEWRDAVPPPSVDPRLTVMRIDDREGVPLGVFSVFSGHPAVVGAENDLWHADVFGVAAHELRMRAASLHNAGAVFAIANSAEGDVSFRWRKEARAAEGGHLEARRLGVLLAGAIWKTFVVLQQDDPSGNLDAAHAYAEVKLPGAELEDGRQLCGEPKYGSSALAGAEEGRSGFHPWLVREGMVWPGSSTHTPKNIYFAGIHSCVLEGILGLDLPDLAPLQVVRIGPYHFVGVPFEMTTQAGRRLTEGVAVSRGVPEEEVILVGLANDYVGYCATREEYGVQHYEGASTLYGPNQAEFIAEQVVQLVERLPRGRVPVSYDLTPGSREFAPGKEGKYFPVPGRGRIHREVDLFTRDDQGVPRDIHVEEERVVFRWRGLDRGRIDFHAGWLVRVEVENADSWEEFRIAGRAENDLGQNFAIRFLGFRNDRGVWEATWHLPSTLVRESRKRYRFKVAGRASLPPLTSSPFELP